jgi:hypothetical protein
VAWEVTRLKTLLLAPLFLAVWTEGPADMLEAHTLDATLAARRINISICNFGELPEPLVSRAMAVIEVVFRSATVELAWRSCEDEAAPLSIPRFWIRLRGEKPPQTTRLASFDAMGRAFVGESGTGYLADIYFGSIRDFAILSGCNAEILLAYTIAHEIGHLLGLGHAGCGVMKKAWGVVELKAQGQNAMNFSQQEAARIRNQVRH